MSYDFYKASLEMFTSAKQSIIDDNQENINELLDASSTYERVEEQQTVGTNNYEEIECRLNSLIDPKTGKSFGDEYRKIIFNNYGHTKWLGQMYRFGGYDWLTTNTNTIINASASSVLRRCNNVLKWYDENGILHNVPCVFERDISSENMKDGSSGVPQIWSTAKVMVQRNPETNSIKLNTRFIFDGFAFQLQQINNHISQTYMELYYFETQTQDSDDIKNNIANGNNEIPVGKTEVKILPMVNSIYLNDTQSFVVNKYVNGIANDDTFDIICSGVNEENYDLIVVDGNNFKIKNLIPSTPLLKITCTDKVTNEIATMSIKLAKSW